VFEGGQGQIEVDGLRDLVGRLHVEGDASKNAERAEMNHSAGEFFRIAGAREVDNVAAGVDEFDGRSRGSKIAVVEAGAVRRRCYGSGDGDVRERGEVVEGKAARIDNRGEVAVTNASTDGDGFGGSVEVDGVEGVKGDLVLVAVGDGIE